MIDTFVVRSLLVPALVALFGRAGAWPGRIARHPVRRAPATGQVAGTLASSPDTARSGPAQ